MASPACWANRISSACGIRPGCSRSGTLLPLRICCAARRPELSLCLLSEVVYDADADFLQYTALLLHSALLVQVRALPRGLQAVGYTCGAGAAAAACTATVAKPACSVCIVPQRTAQCTVGLLYGDAHRWRSFASFRLP